MPFADVEAKTTITGFSAADEATILGAMETAYDGSAIAQTMFDDWIAAGNTIRIDFLAGAFQAFANAGRLQIDLAFLTDANYIDDNGKAVEDTAVTAIVHELVHALTGRRDDGDYVNDYKGATVEFSNTIYDELGLPEQNSYIAYDSSGNILTRNFEYTNGTEIDRSVSQDRDWNSSAAGDSDDLLIGGSSGNNLQSGDGDDFLFGDGGDDNLNGGDDTDTAVLTGEPTDYDVRLNADGTWTSRHVRGDADEGTDTFSNLEKVQFEDGETFDLEKNGLTFQTDFAFVVDQTGSMFDDIDAVQAAANALINALFNNDEVDARIGVVGFRDNTIGEPTQVVLPFTDEDVFEDRKAAALAAINSLGASGGGDLPETAFDGLLKALDGSMGEWRVGAGTKRVVLFTDASAKDAGLAPTVLGLANDIGAVISGRSSEPLGTLGVVDTFELSPAGDDALAARDPQSEGDELPPFVPSDDPVTPLPGTGKVQIFTIFVNTSPDPNLKDITEKTGGSVLPADDPDGVVERLLEIITSTNYQLSVDPDSLFEGDADTTDVTFTLTRDKAENESTVTLEPSGTADDADVTDVAETVDFAIGEFEKTITVKVVGDTTPEPDETFGLEITEVTEDSTFTSAPTTFVILDDDTDGNEAPQFTNFPDDNAVVIDPATQVNQRLVKNFDAEDPDGDPFTFSITGPDAPALSIAPKSGVLYFNDEFNEALPSENGDGTYEVTVTVTDDQGNSTSEDLSVVLDPDLPPDDNPDPVFDNLPAGLVTIDPAAQANQRLVFKIDADDPEDEDLSFSLSGEDAGLVRITTNTGVIYTSRPFGDLGPDADGDGIYEVEVKMTTTDGSTSTESFQFELV